MFVQSHIQRHSHHHNHHQHHNSSNRHGHNHQHHNQQQPLRQPLQLSNSNQKQHNHNAQATTTNQRRAVAVAANSQINEAQVAIRSLTKSTTTTAAAATAASSSTHILATSSGESDVVVVEDNNKRKKKKNEKLESSHPSATLFRKPNENAGRGAQDSKNAEISSNCSRRKKSRNNSDEDDDDHCDVNYLRQNLEPTESHHESCRRQRTRSLGSHKSLKVYNFMPCNTRLARVESAASESYCEPPPPPPRVESGSSQTDGTAKRSALRLAQTVSVEANEPFYSDCRRQSRPAIYHEALADVGGSASDVGSGLSQQLMATSQHLLRIFLDSPRLLAGRLSSLFKQHQRPKQSQTQIHYNKTTIGRARSVELVRSFCMSFIAYQLETWRLLANDLASREQRQSQVGPRYQHQRQPLIVRPSRGEVREFATHHHGHPMANAAANNNNNRGAAELVRSATIADRHTNEMRERKFRSFDRPILERQREIAFDDDGEPAMSYPAAPATIRVLPSRAPPRMQPILATSAPQKHNQRLDSRIQPTEMMMMPFNSFSGYPTNFSQQQQHSINHHHNHQHYHSSTEHQTLDRRHNNIEDELLCVGQAAQQASATTQNHQRMAKFYVGQFSLDCDHHLQAAFSAAPRSAAYRGGPLFEKSEDGAGSSCVEQSQNSRDDDSWSDRPFSDDDFRLAPTVHKTQSAEADCKSMSYNCDPDDDSRNKNTTLLPESRNSRKKRSMKKSSSPLSFEEARRRLGLRRKNDSNQLSSISVNRSEEVMPTEVRHLSRQTTFNSLYDSGTESGSFWRGQSQFPPDLRANFVEGIGVGQIASRQALVSPSLGDIQLSLSSRRGMLEVEVIRARGLHTKAGAKSLPSPYVKVYLMKEKKCIAKCRTHQVNQTLDPLYQEPFVFRYEFKGCVLQVIVWGDYGKRDRKSMMGIVQIHLDDLDISNMVIGWYKLFNIPSMTNSLASSKNLRQKLVQSYSISESHIINS